MQINRVRAAAWLGWLLGVPLLAWQSGLAPALADSMPVTQPGIAEPYCPEQTQQGLNICAALWLKTAEYYKALVYDDLHQGMELMDRVQLAVAEEHWLVFRESQCSLESDRYTGGSIYSLVYGNCMAQVTNDRTGDLQGWGNSQGSQQALESQLQKLLEQTQLTDSDAQNQWKAYRNLQCDFEAHYREEVRDQYQQCVSRLTQTRIERLQAYAKDLNR